MFTELRILKRGNKGNIPLEPWMSASPFSEVSSAELLVDFFELRFSK